MCLWGKRVYKWEFKDFIPPSTGLWVEKQDFLQLLATILLHSHTDISDKDLPELMIST